MGIGWNLDNGEIRHAQNPKTFKIPTELARKSLQPGAVVKLLFLSDATDGVGGERMWVHVAERNEDHYIGWLDNQPAFIPGLNHGDKIAFRPEHVIGIFEPDRSLEN